MLCCGKVSPLFSVKRQNQSQKDGKQFLSWLRIFSPLFLKLHWFWRPFFHTDLGLFSFILFSRFRINLVRGMIFFLVTAKNSTTSTPCPSPCLKPTCLAMISEVFSKSGLDPASLKLTGIFQCFFYSTVTLSASMHSFLIYSSVWWMRSLALSTLTSAQQKVWAVYSMPTLLGVTPHFKKGKKKSHFVAIQLCSHGNRTGLVMPLLQKPQTIHVQGFSFLL